MNRAHFYPYNTPMVNQFLALSLFVMLLAFFIVLNSLSTFESEKTRQIVDSITIAFSSRNADNLSANVTNDPMDSFRDGDSLEKISALFKAEISGIKVTKNRFGTVMHIRVPVLEFEKALLMGSGAAGAPLNDMGSPFLPMLISVLDSEEAIPYRIDMVMNMEGNPAAIQNENPEVVATLSKKVTFYAEKLEASGLPRKLITAGLGEGEKRMMDLYFRPYEPFNPLGDEGAPN